MSDLKVQLQKTINAPIEQVYDAWLDAKLLSRFMTPMPGMPEPRVEADGRQGGTFTIHMPVGDEEIPHRGEYLVVQRPDKLVFTWVSPFSPEGSTVTINFTAVNDKCTEIDFQHVKFLGEEERSNHEGGWETILDKLDTVVGESTVEGHAAT